MQSKKVDSSRVPLRRSSRCNNLDDSSLQESMEALPASKLPVSSPHGQKGDGETLEEPSTEEAAPYKPTGPWTAKALLSNKTSKLTKVNLDELLHDPRAWTTLTREEQLQLLSVLPNAPDVSAFGEDEELPNYPLVRLQESTAMRQDVRLLVEDLAAGRYRQDWLEAGAKAMEERAAGVYDRWKEEEMELYWGQKGK